MADNVTLPGTGEIVAADEVSSAKHQRVKVSLGADGSATDALGNSGAIAAGVLRVTVATDDSLHTKIGEVQASPTSNTILARLKDLLTGIVLAAGTAIIGKVGIDQTTPGTTNKVFITDISAGDYETVAASQSDQAMGASGATGDYLAGVVIVPGTVSPGAVQIKDGSGSAITIFTGGTNSVSNLVPFMVPLGIISGSGAWKITTNANVTAIGVGNFT